MLPLRRIHKTRERGTHVSLPSVAAGLSTPRCRRSVVVRQAFRLDERTISMIACTGKDCVGDRGNISRPRRLRDRPAHETLTRQRTGVIGY